MGKFTLSFLLIFYSVTALFAQSGRICGSADYARRVLAADPSLAQRIEESEKKTAEAASQSRLDLRSASFVVPVVVHVLYNNVTENISDEQIISQIAVLNADFRKKNTDALRTPSIFSGLAADCQINFQLANIDPLGRPTNGIDRVFTVQKSWDTDDAMKFKAKNGASVWNAKSYLNIWICNLNGGVLGYSTFPASSLDADGVVIDYRFFGTTGTVKPPFHLGRTATHEIGHYFNLKHIWGDRECGDDLVSDTPQQSNSNSGAPVFPLYSACSGVSRVEMSMNFMDYVNDAEMYIFTVGQSERMRAVFAPGGPRATLTNSKGFQSVATAAEETATASGQSATVNNDLKVFPNPAADRFTIQLFMSASELGQFSLYNAHGLVLKNFTKTMTAGINTLDFDAADLAGGMYFINVKAGEYSSAKKIMIARE